MSLPLDTGCPERYTLEIFPAVVKIKVMQMSIMLNPHTKFQRRNNFEKYTFFGTLANSQMTFVWQVGLRRGILIANSRGFLLQFSYTNISTVLVLSHIVIGIWTQKVFNISVDIINYMKRVRKIQCDWIFLTVITKCCAEILPNSIFSPNAGKFCSLKFLSSNRTAKCSHV
jgi:hypothetical protein